MKKYFLVLIVVWAILVTSCKKYLDVPTPADQVLSVNVFSSDEKAEAAVLGIYGNMINGSPSIMNFLTTIYGGLSSDEILRFNPSLVYQEFMSNDLTATNPQIRNIWSSAYKSIYYANAVLDGLEKSIHLSNGVKKRLTGECKIVRAYCYFYLVSLFGPVPIAEGPDYSINSSLHRNSVNEVYEFMSQDLNEASEVLGEAFLNGERSRPNRWAAKALLARVYLYKGEWILASQFATDLIGSGVFTPLEDPSNVFLKNSKEAIWQLAPTIGLLPETKQLRPIGQRPQVYIRNTIMSGIEPGDMRKLRWIDSVIYQGVIYHYPSKYKNASNVVTEYYMILRLGEQYLIRAEARVRMGDLNGAIDDINTIRVRAGLSALPYSLNEDEILGAVLKERSIEFLSEWAHRWLDLKRLGMSMEILGPLKPTLAGDDLLYPIPSDEILSNYYLTQNPGY